MPPSSTPGSRPSSGPRSHHRLSVESAKGFNEFGTLPPTHRGIVTWNLVCAIIVIFTAIELPIRLAFPRPYVQGLEIFYIVLDWLLGLFFMVDCVKNFFVAFENIEGDLVTRKADIAVQYLSTWFIIDFVSGVPWDLFIPSTYTVAWTGEQEAGASVAMLTLIRILKAARLLRLSRMLRLWREIGVALRGGVAGTGCLVIFEKQFTSMLMYLLAFLLLGHINGCM